MKHIITTVGTSVYTNFAFGRKVKEAYKEPTHENIFNYDSIEPLENKKANEYTKSDFSGFEDALKKYWLIGIKKREDDKKKWHKWKDDTSVINLDASAEIKSICKIIEESKDTEFKIYLICSDTAICMSAGHLVKAFFEGYTVDGVTFPKPKLENSEGNEATIQDIKICFIEKLQVDNADDFKDVAVMSLIEKIEVIARGSQSEDIILNVSGGYKGVIPIITILGQLQGYELKYIYEDSEKLIGLSKLPINFDWEIAQNVVQLLNKNTINANDERNPYFLEDVNEALMSKLNNFGLVTPKGKKREVSFLGKLLIEFVKQKSIVEKGTLGLFIEYKYYEFFNEVDQYGNFEVSKPDYKYWIDPKTLQTFNLKELKEHFSFEGEDKDFIKFIIEKQKELPEEDKVTEIGDIDLKLKSDNRIILCDVKTADTLRNFSADKILYRLEANKRDFPSEKISEFAVLLYDVAFDLSEKNNYSISENTKQTLQTMRDELKGECDLLCFATNILLTDKTLKVNYNELLKHKLIVHKIEF